jgi:hypothetical protein
LIKALRFLSHFAAMAKVPGDQALRISVMQECQAKCQEKTVAAANFRHRMTAKTGNPT